MSVIDEGYKTQDEETTPTTSPERRKSLAPFCSTTKHNGNEASTSLEEGKPPAIKKLLEARLTNTLVIVMSKQVPCKIVETPNIHAAQHKSGRDDQLNLSALGNNRTIANSAGENALVVEFKRIEKRENENNHSRRR